MMTAPEKKTKASVSIGSVQVLRRTDSLDSQGVFEPDMGHTATMFGPEGAFRQKNTDNSSGNEGGGDGLLYKAASVWTTPERTTPELMTLQSLQSSPGEP